MNNVYRHVGVFVVADTPVVDTVVTEAAVAIVVEGSVTVLLFVAPGHVLVPFSVT
jgi:hypothetical protein